MSLTFRSESDLLHYLTTSPRGKGILREACTEKWITDEILEYNRTTHILVKAYRDGWIEVYGPKTTRARIVFLGRTTTFPEYEVTLERHLDSLLPTPYREVHYPGNRRAIGYRYSGLEKDREVRLPWSGALKCSK